MSTMSIAYSTYAHMLGFGAGVFVLLLLLLGIFKISMYFIIRKMENETFGRISESIDKFTSSGGAIIDDNIAPWIKSYYQKNNHTNNKEASKSICKIINWKKKGE